LSEVTKTGRTLSFTCAMFMTPNTAAAISSDQTYARRGSTIGTACILSCLPVSPFLCVVQEILSGPTNPELRLPLSYSTRGTNQNFFQEITKRRLNSGNVSYHSVSSAV
jgi:hypothetical protein